MSAVSDIRDTRVLIPRVRRALLGPSASASGAPSNEYSDEEVNNLIADSIADVLLYSGGADVFGHTLEVQERDPYYQAPIAWYTEPALSDAAASVIVAQAALSRLIITAETLKTSERIADEGQEWEYQIAATVVTERIKSLRADRDRAIESLSAGTGVSDEYISFLGVRDEYTSSLIEPWADGHGSGGQQFGDPRFY